MSRVRDVARAALVGGNFFLLAAPGLFDSTALSFGGITLSLALLNLAVLAAWRRGNNLLASDPTIGHGRGPGSPAVSVISATAIAALGFGLMLVAARAW